MSKVEKLYLDIDVLEALRQRLDFIFREFANICFAFSGGKDSGALWSLALKYMSEHGIRRRIGLMYQDCEAQYTMTSEYAERVFTSAPDFVERFWICLPLVTDNAMSAEATWTVWDDAHPELWTRPMPQYPYVVRLGNNPLDYWQPGMRSDQLKRKFTPWYRDHCGGGKTVMLLGLRADESNKRYHAIVGKKHCCEGAPWTTDRGGDCYYASPLYDWRVEDVWTANGKFGFDYNRVYDEFWRAGMKLSEMRIASPFLHEGRANLDLFRRIDPAAWAKLVRRVPGANFGAQHGKDSTAFGAKLQHPPAGHSWQSYALHLLGTLPEEQRSYFEGRMPLIVKDHGERGWRQLCVAILDNDHVGKSQRVDARRRSDTEDARSRLRNMMRGE